MKCAERCKILETCSSDRGLRERCSRLQSTDGNEAEVEAAKAQLHVFVIVKLRHSCIASVLISFYCIFHNFLVATFYTSLWTLLYSTNNERNIIQLTFYRV